MCRRSASFDDHDAGVVGHGDEHAPQVLGLHLIVADAGGGRGEGERAELGDAVDEGGDFVAVVAGELLGGDVAVLDDVVQQGGLEHGDAEFEVGAADGGGQGVLDVGGARGAQVARMGAIGEVVGAFEVGDLGGAEVAGGGVAQVVEGGVDGVGAPVADVGGHGVSVGGGDLTPLTRAGGGGADLTPKTDRDRHEGGLDPTAEEIGGVRAL